VIFVPAASDDHQVGRFCRSLCFHEHLILAESHDAKEYLPDGQGQIGTISARISVIVYGVVCAWMDESEVKRRERVSVGFVEGVNE